MTCLIYIGHRNAPRFTALLVLPERKAKMKSVLNFIGFSLVVVCVSVHAAANEGCMYDTQCKIDRICDQGRCVSPSSQGLESDDLPEPKHTQWLPVAAG